MYHHLVRCGAVRRRPDSSRQSLRGGGGKAVREGGCNRDTRSARGGSLRAVNRMWLTSSGGPGNVRVSRGPIYQGHASNRSSSLVTWVKEAELGRPGPLLSSVEERVRQDLPCRVPKSDAS